MNKILVFFLLFGLSICVCYAQPVDINIIPYPSGIKIKEGSYNLPSQATILAKGVEKEIAALLVAMLDQCQVQATITDSKKNPTITFTTNKEASRSKEAYKLNITSSGISIEAEHPAGFFYAIQSLNQLLLTSPNHTLPLVEITDTPRFSWRGLHLDVSRHFFPIPFIKKYIDVMAHYKINTFHWHLTDDQGWRIEIKKYPKLQSIAAFRDETVIGKSNTRNRNDPHSFDGTRHGGYYTQDEIKEVVAYATKHYVTVVPEIEMPGHGLAALAAYPELGCTGGPYQVAETWGVFQDVYCAGKESTFEFLQNVLDEVLPLFPGTLVHIGGDECPKESWKKCPNCQQRIKQENLKDEHELQSYFIRRMERYINQKGKQIIGWDEILEGGLAPHASVMSWRGEEGGIEAAKQHHEVVMTPSAWLYFDYYQDSAKTEPLAIGGYLPVKKVYEYNPVPANIKAEDQKYIIGLQANVWTEYIQTTEHVEYMVYPRLLALAEVAWTPLATKQYDNFAKRLQRHQSLLDLWKVNYARHLFDH